MYHIPDYIDSESDEHRTPARRRGLNYHKSAQGPDRHNTVGNGVGYLTNPSLRTAQPVRSFFSGEWTDATSSATSSPPCQSYSQFPARQDSAIGVLRSHVTITPAAQNTRTLAIASVYNGDEELDITVPPGTSSESSLDYAKSKRRPRPIDFMLSSKMDALISNSVGDAILSNDINAYDEREGDGVSTLHDSDSLISRAEHHDLSRQGIRPRSVTLESNLSNGALTTDQLDLGGSRRQEHDNPRILHLLTRDRHSRSASSTSSQFDQVTPGETSPNPNRSDLGHHLIPSRQSSLKPISEQGMSRHRHYRKKSESAMDSTNETEGLAEDEDSDTNNATLRRIRELQEARGRRQREWRKEARRSERTARRQRHHSNRAAKKLAKELQLADSPVSGSVPPGEALDHHETITEPVEALEETSADSTLASGTTLVAEPDSDFYSAISRATGVSTTPKFMIPEYMRSDSIRGHRRSLSHQYRKSSSSHDERSGLCFTEVKTISDEVQAFLKAPRLTQRIRHPLTGRTITFSEVGDPAGAVVICCVGMGLTRYVTSFYDELARTMKLRLITPDRPGVGGTQAVPDNNLTPLHWVDDVATICSVLEISRFSLLAHSAGAIYALATALKMPQYIRGRIHLLAPWIPPSQMPKGRIVGSDTQQVPELPFAHRFLAKLPTPILKIANSRFLAATSASVEVRGLRAAKNMTDIDILEDSMDTIIRDLTRAEIDTIDTALPSALRVASTPVMSSTGVNLTSANRLEKPDIRAYRQISLNQDLSAKLATGGFGTSIISSAPTVPNSKLTPETRQDVYNKILTHRVWELATKDANPANDLMICFERRRPIGFKYSDVTRSVVIHHGAKDNRVPLDNVRWLQTIMKRCELRVLKEEGHGLMASASVMSGLLLEIGKEWDEWERIANAKQDKRTMGFTKSAAGEETKTSRKSFRRHFQA